MNLRPVGRLIPTHAGKTATARPRNRRTGAHPHSRGENRRRGGLLVVARGSSPLTRGKRLTGVPEGRTEGLIPTHAGKTHDHRRPHALVGAHPHSRGENSNRTFTYPCVAGSSPLTRGKLACLDARHDRGRLIPTHAGKTPGRAAWAPSVPAHPHSRGENATTSAASASVTGSSPLTRGKPTFTAVRTTGAGLIPTHAGKTRSAWRRRRSHPAHPHSRGENAEGWEPGGAISGSSPLTRGKLWLWPRSSGLRRLIPTHAGKTDSATA